MAADYLTHLATYLARHSRISRITTLHEYGYTACPYGLAIQIATGTTILTQTTIRSPQAHQPPTTQPTPNPPPPPTLDGRPPTADFEALYAAAHTGLPLTHLNRYSTRPHPPTVHYGTTATLTDNTTYYSHIRHTLRPGENPCPATLFNPLPTL